MKVKRMNAQERKEARALWKQDLEDTPSQLTKGVTWKESEETRTGLVLKWEGKLRRALTGRLVADEQSECGEGCGSGNVYCEGNFGVGKLDNDLTMRQDEPYEDRQGNWKQMWMCFFNVDGRKARANTDKAVEDLKDERWRKCMSR